MHSSTLFGCARLHIRENSEELKKTTVESRETENVSLIHSVCRQPGVQLSSMGRFVVLDERAMPRSVQVQISSLALRFLV